MIARLLAFSVHLFTASGAFLAFLAMLAAMRGAWAEMFAWLGAALVVDGVDGPMARKLRVAARAARWSGVILDLIVDYLTYVFIPAVALVTSGTMYYPLAIPAAAIIIITGAIYFADTRMKTRDASFQGFPGCWNMVVLVLFATDLTNATGFWIILLISVTQFMPLRFVHPVRTKLWRNVSLPVCCAWVAFAGWACWTHFQQPFICTLGLMASSIYLLTVGVVQQAMGLGRAE
ncbi:phosphatidylcholine synthase [Pikeienuella piscinae]|uniref:Phosphatidylcholine synthase n=1 Tax=Pikeienuella piscinae TaxID=2748098 RepID=A0A7L5C150_9RHOB|nr:phosphatidylcholine synthase [Pikeienuella piscinae]QIE55874.1 phosphatidylcholine synthase [Pikeienuella piscinae]